MRVLVAEDDDATRIALEAHLRAAGYDVLTAVDGDAAWAAVLAFGVDVVLSDWRMPGVDGLELCRRIRERDADTYTYFVLMTAADEAELALDAVRAGVDDHLLKPLDPLLLEARLIAAARVTDLHRQLAERRADLRSLNEVLQETARTDSLTRLYNRHRLDEDRPVLDEGLRRYGRPFAVALVDVDEFKAFNDRYGHVAGDDALRSIAGMLRSVTRQGDVAYRYGGEEFLVVYPAQGLASAAVASERARGAVEAMGIRHEGSSHGVVTISVGIAAAVDGGDLARAVQDADIALYEAKRAGRNAVRAYRADEPRTVHLA